MRKFTAALALGAVLVFGGTQLAQGQTEESATALPATPAAPAHVCDGRCHVKHQYGRLRRHTDRNPTNSCIVNAESGGNLHASNTSGSGAGGRYQIMPSTWASNLPSKRIIGIAQSVEYHFRRLGHDEGPQWSERLLQDIVAANIVAESGLAPWTQYDPC